MAIVMRSYHGDAYKLGRLFNTLRMFVLPNVERIVVLDEESPEDHVLGDKLKNEFGATIFYETLPNISLWHPLVREGYQRQQWSSFYLDKYTNSDVIVQLDADAQISTVWDPAITFDGTGKILIRADPGDFFSGDGFAWNDNQTATFDPMYSNHMPMFFWRSTFVEFRSYMQTLWHTSSFDEAFLEWSTRQPGFYSWQNLLYQYGVHHQPNKYALRLSTEWPAVASMGTNRPNGSKPIQAGCCRSYQLKSAVCTADLMHDYDHLMNLKLPEPPVWMKDSTTASRFADSHYEQVHERIKKGPFGKEFRAMQERCEAFLNVPASEQDAWNGFDRNKASKDNFW